MQQQPKHSLLSRIKAHALKLTIASVVVVSVAFGISMTSSHSQTHFLANACDCETNNSSYNSALPSSHPSNRCATQNNDVSWTNWLSGNSRSSQFHFIDLLELIHGHKQKPLPELPGNQVSQ